MELPNHTSSSVVIEVDPSTVGNDVEGIPKGYRPFTGPFSISFSILWLLATNCLPYAL